MGLVACILIPIFFIMIILQARESRREGKETTGYTKHGRTILSDSIYNHETVFSLVNENILIDRYFKHRESVLSKMLSILKRQIVFNSAEFIIDLIYFSMNYILALEIENGKDPTPLYIAMNA
jgi:ABC-type transport system involved in Fe-S cluster assembly fused permease/ATPase subunit